MRLLAHVIGMFVLGTVALLLPGWLYDMRVMQPAPAAAAMAGTPTGTTGRGAPAPQALLADTYRGIRENLAAFVAHMRGGGRSEAMHALDSAYHLATVAQAATQGAASPVYTQVVAIRRAVQNNDQPAALWLGSSAPLSVIPIGTTRPPAGLADYDGAVVLRPDGTRVGRVIGLSSTRLTIALGPPPLLGLIPTRHSGTTTAAAAEVLFGEVSRISPTMVIARIE